MSVRGGTMLTLNVGDWEEFVETDPRYYRPAEVDLLIGDASKAKAKLGWSPAVTFEQLVTTMVDADLKRHSSGNAVAASTGREHSGYPTS